MAYDKHLSILIYEIIITANISISFIFGILMLFYGYQFYKKRHQLIIKKRYSKIVFVINILAVFLLFIVWPYGYIDSLTSTNSLTNHNTASLFWSITYPFGAYGTVTFNALRYYMIYYDMNFLNSSKDLQWKKYINSSLETLQKENWYISHRHNLGNETFMIKLMSIIIFIPASICMILRILGHIVYNDSSYIYAAQFFDIVFYTFPSLLGFFIFYKTPSFSDTIFIHQEMKYIVIISATLLSLYAICVIIGLSSNHIVAQLIWYLVPSFCGIIVFFSFGFISTYWVLKMIRDTHRHVNNKYYNDDELQNGRAIHSVHTSADTSIYSDLSLRIILTDPQLYVLFMQHLMRELSMNFHFEHVCDSINYCFVICVQCLLNDTRKTLHTQICHGMFIVIH